ncbi:hypothetical protein GGD41_003487 [Paraburkholderia bryophila]|uniref:Uncharacterized protein n=1 Tax=Paraburkholderia bryophila TaxID=420952 RepID=A0A7Y9W8P2_9BURK|nr:hypothetical protein [Paraburkholderia bryophila]
MRVVSDETDAAAPLGNLVDSGGHDSLR